MKDYQKRMVEEFNELNDRVEKLESFITSNETFFALEIHKQKLMKWQLSAMKSYREALADRCMCEGFNPHNGNKLEG